MKGIRKGYLPIRGVSIRNCGGGMLGTRTSLRYSPTSACLNAAIPVGSRRRVSAVERAVTPKPCIEEESVSNISSPILPLHHHLLYSHCVFSPSLLGTYNRRIIHTIHHDSLMLRDILPYPPYMRLQHMIPIQKRHFAIWFNPDFILGVLRYVVQCCDV